jgi:hypothetical protein
MTAARRRPARRPAVPERGLLGLACELVLGLILALAQPVRAEPITLLPRLVVADAQARATQLFEDASRDRDAGLIGQAARKYRDALQLWPHSIIHYDLALVLIELSQPVEAAEHLEEVIKRGPTELGKGAPQIEDARRKLRELLAHEIATVMVMCPRQGARVSIDDKYVLTVGMKTDPLRVDMARVVPVRIGWHMFVAQMPGEAADVVIHRYIGGSARTEIIKLEERWEYRRRRPHLAWVPWTVLGGGVGIGLAGGALQLAASASYQQYDRRLDDCTSGGRACDSSGFVHLRDRGDLERALGIIGYSVAGVAIATGGVLAYLNRPIAHRIKYAHANAAPGPARALERMAAIVPLVDPDGGGVMVMGRF